MQYSVRAAWDTPTPNCWEVIHRLFGVNSGSNRFLTGFSGRPRMSWTRLTNAWITPTSFRLVLSLLGSPFALVHGCCKGFKLRMHSSICIGSSCQGPERNCVQHGYQRVWQSRCLASRRRPSGYHGGLVRMGAVVAGRTR